MCTLKLGYFCVSGVNRRCQQSSECQNIVIISYFNLFQVKIWYPSPEGFFADYLHIFGYAERGKWA